MPKIILIILFAIFCWCCKTNKQIELNNQDSELLSSNEVDDQNLPELSDIRQITFRNLKEMPIKYAGKLVMRICVNREGEVIEAHYLEFESTITDRTSVMQALKGVKTFTFIANPKAPKIQCGKYTLDYDNGR